MKSIKYLTLILSLVLVAGACDQEVIDLTEPDPCSFNPGAAPCTACPEDASAGTANFTKFIALGNSFVAGVQGGALFTEAQNNSLPAIMNKQFECVGGTATFNQPTIGASLGWNLFITQPFLTNNTQPILGRMLLEYGDPGCGSTDPSVTPTPQAYAPGNLEALPNPTFNSGFLYGGSTSELNNFAVPAITVGQALTSATGNWGDPDPAKGFSPFYARFASVPGTSLILSDADAAGGTFALVWLGLDDFFLYAAFGGDPTLAPLTAAGDFGTRLGAIFGHPAIGLFTINPNMKAVVGNFPNIFAMPHFTSVTYNPIPLDATTVGQLNAGFAGYNAALDGLVANKVAFGISDQLAAEITSRKVSFETSCNNKILLNDETLTDLGPYFDALKTAGAINDAQRAALVPYEQCRHSTASDIIPLSAGAVLGEPGTFGIYGVSEPVPDRYVIIPSERDEILAARTAYNAAVSNIATAFTANLALADVSKAMDDFVTAKAMVANGVTITPNINPPTGIYSEDGVHPNTRGYAFLAGVFIDAINTKFGASVPKPSMAAYGATGLPQ